MLKVVVNYYPVITHEWFLKGSFEWKMLNVNAHIAPVTFTLELLRQLKMLTELCSLKDKAGMSIFLLILSLHKAQSDQVRHRHVMSVRSPQWQADHKRTRLYDVIGSMRIRDNSGTREQSKGKSRAYWSASSELHVHQMFCSEIILTYHMLLAEWNEHSVPFSVFHYVNNDSLSM